MAQKKLEKDSAFDELDLDGDGIVSDAELAASEALSKHEKADAQRRMAWTAMGSMLFFTLAVLYWTGWRCRSLHGDDGLYG